MAFNKRIFSLLLEQAKGDRSWRQFSIDCDISYIQMRKLALGQQENSPRKKLIHKIAQNAASGGCFCVLCSKNKKSQPKADCGKIT